jgi:hypothetical protein
MADLDENLTPQDDDVQNAVEMLKADRSIYRSL